MARASSYAKRFPGAVVWPDRRWEFSQFLDNVTQQTENFTQLDERGSWFYEAVGVTDGVLPRQSGASILALVRPKSEARDIHIADLHIDSIKVKTRDR